ncbi:MAG: magnesium-translocating P-type ATPase [Bdellovibrionales bacterium]|nr:magnesium-translocating P-type ATPase [Bdellovibrionales bacterium]
MGLTESEITIFKSARPHDGLGEEEAAQAAKEFGANEFSETPKFELAREFIRLFLSPLVLILIIASIISAALHQPVDATIILLMVVIGIVINFIQTYRSQRAIKDLKKSVAPTATVIRNAQKREIHRSELVPGDIIELSVGDLIPADAGILSSCDFHVQEALLTGESFPVEKNVSNTEEPTVIYFGSSVVNGTATAVVLSTGLRTKFGHIAERLTAPPPETEFDRGVRTFGYLILKTIIALTLFVFVANALKQHEILESLLFAVALAVGLTPEFLPVISAVTLTRGALQLASSKVIVKHLSALQNFGSIDILCSDKTGTITSGIMSLDQVLNPRGLPTEDVFRLAYINSFYESGIHSPLDQCLLKAKEVNLDNIKKIYEIPFDFERRRASVIVEQDKDLSLILKGAPESVLKVCEFYTSEAGEKALTTEDRAEITAVFNSLHEKGLRTLAVASKKIDSKTTVFSREEEQDLVFNGFITFSDPLLPGIVQAIRKLEEDGVQIKILTGDNELVAKYLCEQIGLNTKNFILGDQLDALDDLSLAETAENTALFARVSPVQKHRILSSLKSKKHVVGFMGDGVNDAPSLHTADIGISFSTAADVAKDSSDIILLERNLEVLHKGIIQGRMAFGNMMKYLLMGTSSNFGNMFSMAAASVILPFLPMLPAQIILNNFLYDLAQISIPTDRVDETFTIKPRRWDISLIRNFMLFIGPLSSIFDFITFFILLRILHASAELFHTAWFLESLATQTLVIFSIRTAGSAFRSRPSLLLTVTILCIVFIAFMIPYSPLATDLGFVPISGELILLILIVTTIYLFLVEAVKRKLMRKFMPS